MAWANPCRHHGNGPEQGLEVIRQVGSAGIARVHGDEDGHLVVDRDGGTLEVESVGVLVVVPLSLGLLQGI